MLAPVLLDLQGCAELAAAVIAAVTRFESGAAFARYAGLAPVKQ